MTTLAYLQFFATETEAISHCREVNKGLTSTDPGCVVIIDGPNNNFAVVDLETAQEILGYPDTNATCLIVTD